MFKPKHKQDGDLKKSHLALTGSSRNIPLWDVQKIVAPVLFISPNENDEAAAGGNDTAMAKGWIVHDSIRSFRFGWGGRRGRTAVYVRCWRRSPLTGDERLRRAAVTAFRSGKPILRAVGREPGCPARSGQGPAVQPELRNVLPKFSAAAGRRRRPFDGMHQAARYVIAAMRGWVRMRAERRGPAIRRIRS